MANKAYLYNSNQISKSYYYFQTDEEIDEYLEYMRQYPQFYLGMQAEGREWLNMFSSGAIAKFDCFFTDAMTFTDDKGRCNRIWLEEETWVDDEQYFLDP